MTHIYPKLEPVNGVYGTTTKGHTYKPASYHNRMAIHNKYKTRWKLKPYQQYYVFKIADEGGWKDERQQGLYSIVDKGKEVLGENDERLAFFPEPSNDVDPWHGYPVDFEGISRTLVWDWFNNEVIEPIMRNRLLRFAR